MENKSLSALLTVYDGEPAIFYQDVPDDTQRGKWGEAQYPRITFSLDTFTHAAREKAGSLSVDITCSETGATPEEIEPFVKEALAGVLFTPTNGDTCAVTWKETQVFSERITEREAMLLGMSISFDVYDFPCMETSDPDPIMAINYFARWWDKSLSVIGVSELPGIFVPTREKPAVYFSRISAVTDYATCAVVWMNGEIGVHFFAPTFKDRSEWLEQFSQALALAGEVPMLDGSPMFLQRVNGNTSSDENAGQLKLAVRYGLLRKKKYAHTMMKANMNGGC